MKLTIHLHLVLKLRLRGTVPQLLPFVLQSILHRTDHMSFIFQNKQGGGSVMKSDTSDVQRENKQEFLAPKHCSIRPRPRPKTARANR